MGRPSKFGEPTTAIRVPISKAAQLEALARGEDSGSFVQNSQDDQLLDQLVEQILQQCDDSGVDARQLLLHLNFQSTCEMLDRFNRREQKQFCARLLERYMSHDEAQD